MKLAREIIAQKALDDYRDIELKPGANVKSDAEIDDFVRENLETEYHPSCTCKMGDSSKNDTVVDFHGKVMGKYQSYIYLIRNQVIHIIEVTRFSKAHLSFMNRLS